MVLAVVVGAGACSGGASSDPPVDATADGLVDTAADGSPADAPDAPRDADARAAETDGGAPTTPCGDRLVAVKEPYPASFRVQNGGRVYDVTAPPGTGRHAAKGDGVADDTEALRDAWDFVRDDFVAHKKWASAGGPIVYLPDGVYLVSDTLIYRGPAFEAPTGYDWVDVVDVRFAGESRERTVVKLADHASGFDDPKHPKAVLAYQHPDTRFNNIPAGNALRNLTVDVGRGNPGAAAVYFQGANGTAMSNVLVRSGDGAGSFGFWVKIGSAQGYYRDLTVDGLDYGIFQASGGEVDTAFEHVTLRDQRVAGVVAGAGLSARDLCIDERSTSVPAVRLTDDGSQAVVIESALRGGGHGAAIEIAHADRQSLLLRDVTTTGYDTVVRRAGVDAFAGANVDEWSALPTATMFGGGAAKTLRLPIADTPLAAWGDPATDWANVDDYGAVGDGAADDTDAVQKALRSGKSVVVFRKAAYKLTRALAVPATVRRVDLMYADLGNPSFDVTEPSPAPLRIERGGGYGTITLRAVRPLVISEMSTRFADAAASPATPTTVYLENSANIGGGDRFAPTGETLWARSINDEAAAPTSSDLTINGGTAWIFDYKTENKPVISLLAQGGSVVEVFNGYVNSTVDAGDTPMIVNDRSRMSFVGFTNLGFFTWKTSVEEIRASGTQSIAPAALPVRDKSDVFIPLYSGDAR